MPQNTGMVWVDGFGLYMQKDAVETVLIEMTPGKAFDIKPKSFHDESYKDTSRMIDSNSMAKIIYAEAMHAVGIGLAIGFVSGCIVASGLWMLYG